MIWSTDLPAAKNRKKQRRKKRSFQKLLSRVFTVEKAKEEDSVDVGVTIEHPHPRVDISDVEAQNNEVEQDLLLKLELLPVLLEQRHVLPLSVSLVVGLE